MLFNGRTCLMLFLFFFCKKKITTVRTDNLQFLTASRTFYPRDALHYAVFAVVRCLSVCPSVCHTPVL